MGVFGPDDFANRPYDGANNQTLHAMLGAAMVGIAAQGLPLFWAVLVAGGVIIAWEARQLVRRGATRRDYAADLAYWLAGAGIWASAIRFGATEYALGVLFLAWAVEYKRIDRD